MEGVTGSIPVAPTTPNRLVLGDKTIFIDGGHKGNFDDQDGYPSLPGQLESILGRKKNRVDLPVVTHGHDDEFACVVTCSRRLRFCDRARS